MINHIRKDSKKYKSNLLENKISKFFFKFIYLCQIKLGVHFIF
jgi:hypothetical protein